MRVGFPRLNRDIQRAVREHRLETFHQCAVTLHSIWRLLGKRPRMGLAISGGVDSMALAFLCQEVTKADSKIMAPLFDITDYPRAPTSFAGFIVDHQMRNGSDTEAKEVAVELTKLGIEPHILQMDWSSYGDPSQLSNVETVARTLRYPAIATACRDLGINSLLLAHHANDKHESVLTRIYSNYLGTGLAGMRTVANVPESAGLHGVDSSGRPHHNRKSDGINTGIRNDGPMAIEFGGIKVGRPLLFAKKEDLVTVCTENNVKWFEDKTNRDPTLTLRNTFRHLIRQNALPVALSRHRILQLATKTARGNDEREGAASKYFNQIPTTLDLRSGTATITVPRVLMDPSENEYKLYTSVLRKILEIVSPKHDISIQNLDLPTDFVFNSNHSSKMPPRITAADVAIEPVISGADSSRYRKLVFWRTVPMKVEQAKRFDLPVSEDSSGTKWSDWKLWDGRYWLRVHPPEQSHNSDQQVAVKFLSKTDIAHLRDSLKERVKSLETLERRLKSAKGDSRFTLPAITIRNREHSDAQDAESVVALPSLGWSVKGWQRNRKDGSPECWRYDIRYKHVDLDLGGKHEILTDEVRAAKLDRQKYNHQHS